MVQTAFEPQGWAHHPSLCNSRGSCTPRPFEVFGINFLHPYPRILRVGVGGWWGCGARHRNGSAGVERTGPSGFLYPNGQCHNLKKADRVTPLCRGFLCSVTYETNPCQDAGAEFYLAWLI